MFRLPNHPKRLVSFTHSDSRGTVEFINSLDLSDFKRAYIIENSLAEPFRGWHGHKQEAKVFICIQGSVRVGAVEIDSWLHPTGREQIFAETLQGGDLSAFVVPSGFANGFVNLEAGSRLLVLSDSTLQESKLDDFRFPPDTWLLPPEGA